MRKLWWYPTIPGLTQGKDKYGWTMCSAVEMKVHYLSVNMIDGEDSDVVAEKTQGLCVNQRVRKPENLRAKLAK